METHQSFLLECRSINEPLVASSHDDGLLGAPVQGVGVHVRSLVDNGSSQHLDNGFLAVCEDLQTVQLWAEVRVFTEFVYVAFL